MLRSTRSLWTHVACAAAVAGSMAIVQPAVAGMRHHHHHGRALVVHTMYVPAHLRPGYVGLPGYAGGPPGTTPPMLIDFPNGGLLGTGILGGNGLLGGGGLLGTGLPLQTGLFTGVPLLGQFGL